MSPQAPAGWVRSVMESQLTVEFNNGSIIILGGMDYADSLRGQASDCLVLDEFCYSSNLQESYEGALLPMLATTNGDTVFASTPSGAGSFAQQLWERAADIRIGSGGIIRALTVVGSPRNGSTSKRS